jgi:hypothetical protein
MPEPPALAAAAPASRSLRGGAAGTRRTPEEELVVALVRHASGVGRLDDSYLGAEISWPALAGLLDRLRLLELAGGSLVELRQLRAPDALTEHVARLRRRAARWTAVQDLALSRVLGALTGAGVRAAPIKGVALAAEAFGRPDVRPSADLDVLVEPGDLDRAVETLVRLGWDPPEDLVGPDGMPGHHFRLASARSPWVELHWRVHWYESSFAPRALARARPSDGGLRMTAEDHLAIVLLVYARDGLRGLRLAADIAALTVSLDRRGERRLDPSLLAGPLRRPLIAASLAVEAILGISPVAGLGPAARPDRRIRTAVSLADPLLRVSDRRAWLEPSLADVLLAPSRGTATAVGRQFLPRTTAIPDRPGAGAIRRSAARPEHVARVARGYLQAVPRLAVAALARPTEASGRDGPGG